eukprot:TRINITY_DN6499_c0_g1_i2.p1 TRINITY_DN6499_c0_g1~~TRINITY_DN6499_c0_g1_i2.p1  ORF type:complete len:235 (+),score=33.47 TRINITY_DN6499_c0_g1_i2:95-799(+)
MSDAIESDATLQTNSESKDTLSCSDAVTREIRERLKQSPFSFCNFTNLDFVSEVSGRVKCPNCTRSCKYYCAFCMKPTCNLPVVQLPIKLDIIHHPSERRQKSTAMHAAVMSPSATIYENPGFPDYDPETTLLLFPSKDSKLLEDIDLTNCKTVVFIDSTWQQSGAIFRQDRLANIPCVKIHTYKTAFWRYNLLLILHFFSLPLSCPRSHKREDTFINLRIAFLLSRCAKSLMK